MADARMDRLRRLLRDGAVRFGKPDEFLLASGKRSDAYVDGRMLTLTAEGASLLAELFWDRIAPLRPDAVGGMTLGADPIVGALLAHAGRAGIPLGGFLVRKEPKKHGTMRSVEGPRPAAERPRVVVLDDTATTGGSTVRAIERVREEWGADVVGAFFVVDREEGARENLARVGVPCEGLVRLAELRP